MSQSTDAADNGAALRDKQALRRAVNEMRPSSAELTAVAVPRNCPVGDEVENVTEELAESESPT